MLLRKALIIGAPDVKPPLPGVIIDVNDIQNYLKSPTGGAWQESEIEVMMSPRAAEVEARLRLFRGKDYVLVTCSGHGAHLDPDDINSTFMYLQEKETMRIRDMNPGNLRFTIIADICREFVPVHLRAALEDMAKSMVLESAPSWSEARRLYDMAIMANPEGGIIAYSCDINQTAADDGTGGFFTQELLKAPMTLATPKFVTRRVVDIYDAFQFAKERTLAEHSPQRPVLDAGRRRTFFPFGII